MSKIYTTLGDLIDQEIVPAISAGEGVGRRFDLDGFVAKLRDEGLIRYVQFERSAQHNGFELVAAEDGNTPRFWGYVQEFDR